MTAIMPLQENETNQSGGCSATAGLRFVLALSAIVVGAGAMFLLLLPLAAARGVASGLAVLHAAPTGISAQRFVAGHAIAWGKLDLKLDDFVPLLVCPIAFWDRQKFAQATTVIRRRWRSDCGSWSGNFGFGWVFWIGIIHCKLKSGARRRRTPHSMTPRITSF